MNQALIEELLKDSGFIQQRKCWKKNSVANKKIYTAGLVMCGINNVSMIGIFEKGSNKIIGNKLLRSVNQFKQALTLI